VSAPRQAPGVTLALSLLCACNVAPAADAGAPVADSAGVPVVQNPATPPPGSPAWSLSPDPELVIGVVDGPPEYTLFQPFDGVRLSDGTIVVANAGTEELRFYDASGAYLGTSGGAGDGPGEFRSLRLAGVFRGDSLLAFDPRSRRASVFGPSGEFTRSFQVPDSVVGAAQAAGVLADGRIVLARIGIPPRQIGVVRPPVFIDVLSPTGEFLFAVGEFPGSESSRAESESSSYGLGVPFGRGVSYVASGSTIAVGTDDAFSVRIYSGGGGLTHVVRQERTPLPADPAEIERYLELAQSRQLPPENARMRALAIEQLPRHTTRPAFADLYIDRPGNLWIQESEAAGAERRRWQVFGPEGVLVASVEGPGGLEILDIGEDYLLGTLRDALGVEQVLLYRLRKEGGSRR
jgi:hypothetical protein